MTINSKLQFSPSIRKIINIYIHKIMMINTKKETFHKHYIHTRRKNIGKLTYI